MPSYRIQTLGCKLNQADSTALEARLLALGLERAAAGGAADVVVLNTCTVTSQADREARQIARRLRREHPRGLVIAAGCYAERDPAALRAVAGIDHVVSIHEQLERVPALAAEALGLDLPEAWDGLGPDGATAACDPGMAPGDRTRALLKIQDGCDLRCSYCVIPAVRGASRSLPPEAVLNSLRRLIDAGFREVVLTGVNTGDYGRDLDPPASLAGLLESAAALPGLGRLRLNSLEPRTVTDAIVRILADRSDRIASHVQVPLQSGSDTVLKRMCRPYRTRDYARVVETLRSRVDGIGLGADVIAGFPGETDAEFEATRRFIASSPLNYLHVFPYSSRPGTAAAGTAGHLPPPVVKERVARLRALGAEMSLRFRASFVGRSRTALVLRQVRADGRLRTLTDNFIDLGLQPGPGAAVANRLIPVRITAATPEDTLGALV